MAAFALLGELHAQLDFVISYDLHGFVLFFLGMVDNNKRGHSSIVYSFLFHEKHCSCVLLALFMCVCVRAGF